MRSEQRLRSACGALRLCRLLLPYGLLPIAALVAFATWRVGADRHITIGVTIGGGILAGLVVVRQIIALLDTDLEAWLLGNEQRAPDRVTQDALTDLPHHMLLEGSLLHTASIARHNLRECSLLRLDLDRFTEVSDPLDPHLDDQLLMQVAKRLRDTIPATAVVARLGGDEFAILLPATDAGGADILARAVRTGLEEPFVVQGQSLSVGVSVGVSLCTPYGGTASTLSERVEVAGSTAEPGRLGAALYDTVHDDYEYRVIGERARASA